MEVDGTLFLTPTTILHFMCPVLHHIQCWEALETMIQALLCVEVMEGGKLETFHAMVIITFLLSLFKFFYYYI